MDADRFDELGNPMGRAGCPNCGAGTRWISVFEWAGLKNSGHDPMGPCSRRCQLQMEWAAVIEAQRIAEDAVSGEAPDAR